jgi:hypothetical protein
MSEPMSTERLAEIRGKADEAKRGFVYVDHHHYGRDVPDLLAEVDRLRAALARVEVWAFEEEDFTGAVGFEYIQGFRDAQKVALGLVHAWAGTVALAEVGRG